MVVVSARRTARRHRRRLPGVSADDALALLEGQEPASEKTDTDFFNSFDDDFDDEDVA